MKWKIVALAAVLVLVLPTALFAAPQAGDIVFRIGRAAYQYDGETIPMSAAPIIIGGRTYLPVRDVAQALGASVYWNLANQTITVDPSPGVTISGTVGNDIPLVVSVGHGPKINAVVDTGSTITGFPETYLRKLGYTPISKAGILLSSGQTITNLYKIPYPIVYDNGSAINMGTGYITVIGLPNDGQALIGLNILSEDDARLTLRDNLWKLTILSPRT